MPGIGVAPRRSVVAEDVRAVQPWTGYDDLALPGRLMLRSQQREPVERAHDRTDRGGGDTGVERGGLELGVPEQDLDDADVDVLFQQMRGEAMPERVRGHALGDPGLLRGRMEGAVELARGEGVDRVWPGNSQTGGRAMRHQSRKSASNCGESIA